MPRAIDKREEYARRTQAFWAAEEARLARDRWLAAGGSRFDAAVRWFKDRAVPQPHERRKAA